MRLAFFSTGRLMQEIAWHNGIRKIADLKPAPYNPREATEKDCQDLNASLQRFGLPEPIVINLDNTIIGGHFRIRQLTAQGQTEVEVRIPSRQLSLEEEMELNLRLNKNTGRWSFDALANMDEDLLKAVGFEAADLDAIFQLDLDKAERANYVPAKRDINIKPGDLFQLGKHRLLCGDATDPQAIRALMGGSRAAMHFTDPPYNVDYEGGMTKDGPIHRERLLNDRMGSDQFQEFLFAACQQIIETTDGAIYICMFGKELHNLRLAFDRAGGHWQTWIIWVKNTWTLCRSDYQQLYEPILYGWPSNIKNHYFIDRRDLANVWEDLKEVKTTYQDGYTTIAFQGFKIRLKGEIKEGEVCRRKSKTNIWRYDKPASSELHPTMKPVELVSEAIRNSSEREGTVADFFAGSGSTLMACELENRACFALELDPSYCQVIIDRWEEFTKQKAVQVLGGTIGGVIIIPNQDNIEAGVAA